MCSNIFGLRIVKYLIMLDCEILPLNLFFELFSLNMTDGWLVEAILDVSIFNGFSSGFNSSITIVAVLEFIAQVEISSS